MSELLNPLVRSFQRLADSAGGLSDADCRAPSRLPDWSRGHVLTHVARNADAMVNLLVWARTGEERPMYASPEARETDIQSGAGRGASALSDDLGQSQDRFVAAVKELSDRDWEGQVANRSGTPLPVRAIPVMRMGETEIHHTDLDVGYEPESWPNDWVTAYIGNAAQSLPERAGVGLRLHAIDAPVSVGADDPELLVGGPQAMLLAWVVGRYDGAGLTVEPKQLLPDLGPWR